MIDNNFIPRRFKSEAKNFDGFIHDYNISIILGETGSGKTYLLKDYYTRNQETSKYVELVALDYEETINKNIEVVLLDSIDEALYHNPSDKILKKKISKYILQCREVNENVKFVIACRYSEWKKKIYIDEFRNIDKDYNLLQKKIDNLDKYDKDIIRGFPFAGESEQQQEFRKKYHDYSIKTYEFELLIKQDINKILELQKVYLDTWNVVPKKTQEKIDEFWSFVEKNYLCVQDDTDKNTLHISNIQIILHLIDNFRKYEKEGLKYDEVYQRLIEENLLFHTDNERSTKLEKMSLDEVLKIVSAIEFYRIKNNFIDRDVNVLANKISSLIKSEITGEKLSNLFDSSMYDKEKNSFFSIYLSAYYLNQHDNKKIKEVTLHEGGTVDIYDETLVYLTNLRPELFSEFVEINPFIFRKHPNLDEEKQKKLLISLLNKLQDSVTYAKKEKYFKNSTLVEFDKLKNLEDIIDEEIDKSKINGSLYFYLMYITDESFYFQKLKDIVLTDKSQGLDIVRHISSNLNLLALSKDFIYNLFKLMKENSFLEKSSSNTQSFESKLFDYFEEDSEVDFSDYVILLDYIHTSNQSKKLRELDRDKLLIYWNYIEKNFKEELFSKSTINVFIESLLSKGFQPKLLSSIIDFLEIKNISNQCLRVNIIDESNNVNTEYKKEFWKIYFLDDRINKNSILLLFFELTIEEFKELTVLYAVDENFEKYSLLQKLLDDSDVNEYLSTFETFEEEVIKKRSFIYPVNNEKLYEEFNYLIDSLEQEEGVNEESYIKLFNVWYKIFTENTSFYSRNSRTFKGFYKVSNKYFSTLISEIIKVMKLETKTKQRGKMSDFIFLLERCEKFDSSSLLRLIKYLKKIPIETFKSLEAKDTKETFLKILILDETNFEYIQDLMKADRKNTTEYLRVLFRMNINKTIDFFMKYYNENKKSKELYIALLSSFISQDIFSNNKVIFLDKVEQKYIKELIIDFYEKFNRCKSLKFEYTRNSHFYEGRDTLLWDFLNDKKELESLKEFKNRDIFKISRHQLKGIYDKEAKDREIVFNEIVNQSILSSSDIKNIQKVKVVVCFEGYTDIEFIKNINQNIQEFKDIININDESCLLIPLGGSTLEHWIENKYLDKLGIPQLHIYDSDVNQEDEKQHFKYKKHIDKIKADSNKNYGFITKKAEIENYIHPLLVEECYEIETCYSKNINTWLNEWNKKDLASFINKETKRTNKKSNPRIEPISSKRTSKKHLTNELSKKLTKEHLIELEAYEEIKDWFKKIQELILNEKAR